jgi:DNA-directed RNA polymerase specialized sigma24 family protein
MHGRGNPVALKPEVDAAQVLQRLYALIQRLKPLDREIIILHLEGLPADEISEIAQVNAGDRA